MSNIFANPQAPLSTADVTEALHQQIEYLIRQFGKLVSLASPLNPSTSSPPPPPESPSDEAIPAAENYTTSLPSAAVQAYVIAAETQAFITNIENLTTLTRRMKEAWMFGELDTIGASKDVEEATQRIAREVAASLMKPGEVIEASRGN